ncbi:tryptophan halogenase family protein [Aquisalinus flavus]|uniref:Tryptophan halogenase n=1 Tax=Aquisalinus flavus TaxID=1526572 RepID=A0A8J2V117_9PROT|nr:tryptophan halogenase family protein [Aquisalinus flavus]MBD0427080.1 tryptophan 7-halogenase [Aquisalinus flavus]UNE46903.1 tryptophan 7-halogenase [Aquisalinus flavus]GGC98219.1 tryptophan halogenase [Aquisalinus flavus]
MEHRVRKVVIAGGGTAGWTVAAALGKVLGTLLDVTLVESDDIGTVGVGEATIPTMRTFHHLLGIDERDFMRETNATFKLGIAFENWGEVGDRYIHSFGTVGRGNWMGDFQNLWLEAREKGFAGEFGEYCFELQAAEAGRFYTGEKAPTSYAFHLDATAYGQFLRRFSEQYGVRRQEGKIATVDLDGESGDIAALVLESGERIEGDLFIDCTGFRGLLIEDALKTGYEDWTHWLPTDSALAVQTQSVAEPLTYTRAMAHDAGWQWRIPLQHRVGNGLVFCSEYLSDDAARDRLAGNIEGEQLTEPRMIRYRTGRRKSMWTRNCVALGLSSGFIEPLESTSIHLIQIGITRLLKCFPFGGISEPTRDHFNELMIKELECIRDFIVLHYKATERDDSPFWQRCRDMAIPDSLAHRIELFRQSALVHPDPHDLFRVDSWLQVMMGQRMMPQAWHRMGALMTDDQLRGTLVRMKENITRAVGQMPTHQAFIERYCANGSTNDAVMQRA